MNCQGRDRAETWSTLSILRGYVFSRPGRARRLAVALGAFAVLSVEPSLPAVGNVDYFSGLIRACVGLFFLVETIRDNQLPWRVLCKKVVTKSRKAGVRVPRLTFPNFAAHRPIAA